MVIGKESAKKEPRNI